MAGGLVAGVFAVVKGIQAVEEAVKGVNKELVDAYGATDLMAEGSDSAKTSVNEIEKLSQIQVGQVVSGRHLKVREVLLLN